MISQRSWCDVVSQIQRSGLQQRRKQQIKTQKRYQYLQEDLLSQINEVSKKRKQQKMQKQLQRKLAQQKDKKSLQQKIMQKQKMRQVQKKVKQQNFQLISKKKKTINLTQQKQSDLKFQQNPITVKLFNNCSERRNNRFKSNKQYDSINKNLMIQRHGLNLQEKNKDNKEALQYQNYVQQKFKKLDQERYQFKKGCLDGKSRIQNTKMILNEPDSLQKQYSAYLQQQIQQKNRIGSRSKSHVDDKINDQNLLKINHDLQRQTQSPAYLGRINSNHDRQKQLNYLDNQIYGHRRFRTQAQINGSNNPLFSNVNSISNIGQKNNRVKKTDNSFYGQYSPNLEKIEKPRPQVLKQFKQYNILTGTSVTRNQYTTQYQ